MVTEQGSENKSIITHNPEEEIWYYFSKLTRLQYVIQQLRRRVANSFYGLDTNAIMSTKKVHKARTCIDTYTPICTDEDLESNAEEITHTARQAIEIYNASQSVSIYAKPILLYYCYRRLASILFLATYKSTFEKAKRGSDTHGLSMDIKHDTVVCKPAGSFARFQDSYYSDPSMYLEGTAFRWQDLIEPSTQRFYLFDNMKKDQSQYHKNILNENNLLTNNRVEIKHIGSEGTSSYIIHELAREFMFTYSMSMLARYDVLKWKRLMDDLMMWKIEGYLKTTQLFFPNLIFNEFHGIRFFFYGESRVTPDKPYF